MKKRFALAGLALLLIGSTAVRAQDASQNQTNAKKSDVTQAVTPLRIQVVFTELDGDKKVSSLPYTFSVNADERRTRPSSQVRNGARIPVTIDKDKISYMDIGTNIDCSALLQDDGRYKLTMNVERSSISQDTNSPAISAPPIVRQFRAEINPVLKDGQTIESIVATDPLNGHVYHVSVTLTVLK
jgi:hypothetical protein